MISTYSSSLRSQTTRKKLLWSFSKNVCGSSVAILVTRMWQAVTNQTYRPLSQDDSKIRRNQRPPKKRPWHHFESKPVAAHIAFRPWFIATCVIRNPPEQTWVSGIVQIRVQQLTSLRENYDLSISGLTDRAQKEPQNRPFFGFSQLTSRLARMTGWFHKLWLMVVLGL